MAGPNSATITIDSGWREILATERAYLRAYDDLKQLWQQRVLSAERSPGMQMMVAAVSPEGEVRSLSLPAGQFRIIGRHTQCALCLDDPEVSLRHLAIYWNWEGEVPVIWVWDLRTGIAFCTEDGQKTRSVVAERLLFAALGRYRLIVVPIGPEPPLDDARYAWESLPERRFAKARTPSERIRDPRITTLTHTLPPVVFGGDERVEGREVGLIRVEGKEGNFECRVTDEQLERGLLFGRYERCRLSVVGDHWLSRVHLLVVSVGGQRWAVDTASRNGTQRNGVPIRALPLDDSTLLLLGRACLLRWTPRAL